MKRIISVILCASVVLSFLACKQVSHDDLTAPLQSLQQGTKTVYIPVKEEWIYSDGSTATFVYTYDQNNHLIQIHRGIDLDGKEIICTVSCDAQGRVLQIKHGGRGGYNETYTYDELGRVQSYSTRGGENTYTYDDAGNLVKIETPLDEFRSNVTEYTYRDNSLTEVTYRAADGSIICKRSYAYDSQGRILEETVSSEGTEPQVIRYSYSEDGRTVTVTDGNQTEARIYDEHGNLISLEFIGEFVTHKCTYTYKAIEVPKNLIWKIYFAPIAH